MVIYNTDSINISELVNETFNGITSNTLMQKRAVWDIIKDSAINPSIGSACTNFRLALLRLFPNGGGYNGNYINLLKQLKEDIKRNRSSLLKHTPITFLKVFSTENKVENSSIRVTTDSGIHISNIQKDYKEYRTFASTIDPFNRNKDNTLFFPKSGDSVIISSTMLRNLLGFPIEYINSKWEGNICRTMIKIDGLDEITIDRSVDTEQHVGLREDYCIGNAQKNQKIRTLCESDTSREIDKYLLVKELGDVMQVILAYIMKKLYPSDAIDVVVTTDDVVRSLCEFFTPLKI